MSNKSIYYNNWLRPRGILHAGGSALRPSASPSNIILWNKLENTTSEVGPNFTDNSVGYEAGKWNNGIYSTAATGSYYTTSDLQTVDVGQFSMEFWLTFRTASPFSLTQWFYWMGPNNVSNPNWGPMFWLNTSGTTLSVVGISYIIGANWLNGTQLTCNIGTAWDSRVGEDVHIGVVYDYNGGLPGGGYRIAIYVDNVAQTMTPVSARTANWYVAPNDNPYSPNPIYLLTRDVLDACCQNFVLDNFKIHNEVKSSFDIGSE